MKKHILTLIVLLQSVTCLGAADLIKPEMLVNILVAGVPASESTRIGNRYLTDEAGQITLPLLDKPIKISGLSSPKAAVKIAETYKSEGIFSSPVFTVTTYKNNEAEAQVLRMNQEREAENRRRSEELRLEKDVVHITGEANKPGKYRLTHNMTIDVLLAECGGDAEFGSNRRFILKRNGVRTEYDYYKTPSYKDMRLKAGDIIEIPEGSGFSGKR